MYIIGTVGPNVKDSNALKGILNNGVNTLRFNFAHGSENEFLQFLNRAKEINDNINIILDLSGSKIRVSNKFEYIYKVYDDEIIYFCGEDKYEMLKSSIPKVKIIPLNIKDKMLSDNEYKQISIKDNTMIFDIMEKEHYLIKARTIKGGIIRKGKGCNIKDLDRSILSLSKNDKKALMWGIKNNVDIICQSFVEDSEDIKEVNDFLDNHKKENFAPKIWAKIETLNGINNAKEILNKVDGIVIGRGDLIPETSLEDTPLYEDKIINEVLKSGSEKDIIIATHLFNSMKDGKMPSISEVESVYNFIKKGVTGFLLAGETSIGKAPIKTVEFLNKLVNKYSGM